MCVKVHSSTVHPSVEPSAENHEAEQVIAAAFERRTIMKSKIAAVLAVLSTTIVAVASPAIGAKNKNTAPAHDGFDTALVIPEIPFTHSTITRGAGIEEGEPQPSCGAVARTLWYRFTPESNTELLAEAVGQYSTIAVYTGSELTGLTENGCSLGSANFEATAGQTYHFQVGGLETARGNLQFSLKVDKWREKQLLAPTTVPVDVAEQNVPLLKFHGRPRSSDPDVYDVTIWVTGQQPINKGVRVGRRIPEIGPVELLKLPGHTGRLTVAARYRYDVTQQKCLVDDGPGQKCDAAVPIDTGNPGWVAGEGQQAEMVIDILGTYNGTTVVEQTVRIPIVGQVLALVP
jgi:hypothetical protein